MEWEVWECGCHNKYYIAGVFGESVSFFKGNYVPLTFVFLSFLEVCMYMMYVWEVKYSSTLTGHCGGFIVRLSQIHGAFLRRWYSLAIKQF